VTTGGVLRLPVPATRPENRGTRASRSHHGDANPAVIPSKKSVHDHLGVPILSAQFLDVRDRNRPGLGVPALAYAAAEKPTHPLYATIRPHTYVCERP
jgi:hypothetical protein